jgi:hypothetical protein
MTTVIADIDEVLKKDILPAIQDLTFKKKPLLDKIKKDKGVLKLANNTFYVTAQTGHHSGIQHVAENVELFPGQPAYEQLTIPAKYGFGHFEITDQTIQATRKMKGALAPALQRNGMSLRNTFARELNRILLGDGTGQLCLVNGAGSGTTVTVDTPGTDYIYAGGKVKIGANAITTVSSVLSSTQFTVADSQTLSDDTVVTRANADEPMGLLGIIDDGDLVATIQGYARASYVFSNSPTDDTAEALTEGDMISLYLTAKKFGSDRKVWVMGQTMYEKYGAILTSMKRSRDTKEVLSGGWRGLEFMGGESGILLDHDVRDGYGLLVDLDDITRGEMTEMGWLEEGSGGILTRVANYANWQGTLRYYHNNIALGFQSHARFSNKTA